MDRFFYIIFNSYYKHGSYRKDIPSVTVFGIFVGFFFGLILLLIEVNEFFKNPRFKGLGMEKTDYYLLGILSAAIVYFLFYFRKRYAVIYEKYKDSRFLNSKGAKILGFCVAVLFIISPLLFGIVRNKIIFGYWV